MRIGVGLVADRQLAHVDIIPGQDDFPHRTGAGFHDAARGLAQAVGERGQKILFRDAQGAGLQIAVLDQRIDDTEAGLVDDVLEHHRPFALGGYRTDVFDMDRLGDGGHDLIVGFQPAAKVLVDREVPAFCGRRGGGKVGLAARRKIHGGSGSGAGQTTAMALISIRQRGSVAS